MPKELDRKKMQKMIELIRKTLRLAGDGTDDEGQSAMLKAQELMAKHRLTLKDIELDDESENINAFISDASEYTKMPWWMKTLAVIIGDNFRCYPISRSYNKQTKMTFMGLEEDVIIAVEVFEYAIDSIKFFSNVYVKKRKKEDSTIKTAAIKNDYITGYLSGLTEKFKEQVEKEQFSLVLVKDQIVVNKFEEMKLKKEKIKSKKLSDTEAVNAGYVKGKEFSTM